MRRIALLPHTGKREALALASELIPRFRRAGVDIVLDEEVGSLLNRPAQVQRLGLGVDLDACIVLGGDGALLKAARELAPRQVPLLGVNLGQLGFLTELELDDLDLAVEKLLNGDYTLEDRMMLEARVVRKGRIAMRFLGLNDAVLSRGTFARIVTCDILVRHELVSRFAGDGLIVSTPTGSTAYSLSAGGPIVTPTFDCFVVTPICPHSLTARPFVMPPTEPIQVKIETPDREEVMLTVDGQLSFKLRPADEISVLRAQTNARFIKILGRSFYRVVRTRFSEKGGVKP